MAWLMIIHRIHNGCKRKKSENFYLKAAATWSVYLYLLSSSLFTTHSEKSRKSRPLRLSWWWWWWWRWYHFSVTIIAFMFLISDWLLYASSASCSSSSFYSDLNKCFTLQYSSTLLFSSVLFFLYFYCLIFSKDLEYSKFQFRLEEKKKDLNSFASLFHSFIFISLSNASIHYNLNFPSLPSLCSGTLAVR